MKKSLLLLSILVLVFTCISGGVFAKDAKPENALHKISENLSVSQFEDGRIAPVSDSSTLNKNELDQILLLYGFQQNELQRIPEKMKMKIVEQGGKRVETTPGTAVYTSTDEEGNVVAKVEASSLEELKQIEKQYKGNVTENKENKLTIMNDASDTVPGWDEEDGIFKAKTFVIFLGQTHNSLENRYSLWHEFEWESVPFWDLSKDSFALAWGSSKDVVKLGGSEDALVEHYYIQNNNTYYGNFVPNLTSDLEGHVWDFRWTTSLPLAADDYVTNDPLSGFGLVEIRIPTTHNGTTFTYGGAYQHPHFSLPGVGITIRGVGFDFNGTGSSDNWFWDESFEIGTN